MRPIESPPSATQRRVGFFFSDLPKLHTMPSFGCICGVATRDEEARGTNFVAYPAHQTVACESNIAKHVVTFIAARDQASRAAWLASYFSECYPIDQPDRHVVEDIVSRELNDGFMAMFKCPACGRIWLCDPVTEEWTSFIPERGRADI